MSEPNEQRQEVYEDLHPEMGDISEHFSYIEEQVDIMQREQQESLIAKRDSVNKVLLSSEEYILIQMGGRILNETLMRILSKNDDRHPGIPVHYNN